MSRNVSKAEQLSGDVLRLQQLIMELGRVHSLRDPIASTSEQMQLTPSQVHALIWLGHDGPLTMGDLARRLGITEKTVTGIVDRLEREGLAQRERSATDRRVVLASVTPEGQHAHQELDRVLRQRLGELLELLDSSDRKALLRTMEKLIQRAKDPSAAPAARRSRSAP